MRRHKTYSFNEKKLALETFFSSEHDGAGRSLREFSRICGIENATLYYWVRKIDGDISRVNELRDTRKRKSASVANGLSEPVQGFILTVKRENPSWGPLKLKQYLFRHHQVLIPQTSIYRFLKSQGLVKERTVDPAEKTHNRSFEYPYPLAAVQMDLLSVSLSSGSTVFLVTLLDDFSRFVLAARFIPVKTMAEVTGVFRETVAQYGVMDKLLTDCGSEFVSWQRFTRFEQLLVDLDIEYIASGPDKKENQGKIERWHQTVRQQLRERGPLDFSSEAQFWIRKVADFYNYERPHQALGGLVPADRFFSVHEELDEELSRLRRDHRSDRCIHLVCRLGDRKVVLSGPRPDNLSLLVDGVRVLDASPADPVNRHASQLNSCDSATDCGNVKPDVQETVLSGSEAVGRKIASDVSVSNDSSD